MATHIEHAIVLEVREDGALLILLDQRRLNVFPADISRTRRWIVPKAVHLKSIPLHGLEVISVDEQEVAMADWGD